jgi:hypothetical protein
MELETSRELCPQLGENLYRSGLVDSVYRVSVNLKGGPAMPPQEFIKWRRRCY